MEDMRDILATGMHLMCTVDNGTIEQLNLLTGSFRLGWSANHSHGRAGNKALFDQKRSGMRHTAP
jgi:hypothetical protein